MKQETFAPSLGGDIDKGRAILSVCWAFVLCAFISTALRVWVRARLTRNLGADDAVMALAMATTILGASFITAEVVNGLGRHEYYLTASQRRNFQAIGWADWVQVFITLALTKISICLFLLRIVSTSRVKAAMFTIIGVTILFTSVCVFLFLGVCRPLKAYWDVGVDGKCLSNPQVEGVIIAQGVLSIVTDLVCAALPAIFLRDLQINRRTKIGLCMLMGLGVITAVCCIVRTALSGAITDEDLSWSITSNVGWRLPEVDIGIVCANAPLLRPLYLFSRGRLRTQRTASAMTGKSDERIWPKNSKNMKLSPMGLGSDWHHGSEGTTAEIEMGLPIHGISNEGQQPPPNSPLEEKQPWFSSRMGKN